MFQPDRLSPAVRPSIGPNSSAVAPVNDHLLSQLLMLETVVAAGDIRHTQRPATAPSKRSQSKMSRIETLKATAASLSNRIENEARKLAWEGINCGTATSVDVDPVLAPWSSQANLDDRRWAETSPHAPTENNDMAMRIQRILTSAGHSSCNGTALPGVGNLHTFRGQKEMNGMQPSLTNPLTTSADLIGHMSNNYIQEGRKLVNGLEKVVRTDKLPQRMEYEAVEDKVEKQTELHDSSAGSISEGPLLSEGSFSEDEASPTHPSSHCVPRATDRLEAVDFSASQRRDYQRLSDFQREAAKCSALSPTFAQQDSSKAAWEELNKGSPLSVINIFTKNLHKG